MSKEFLDSNRINYLIWRYLQESNFPETALRLQKDWDIDNPQELPFAPHVQQNTLVKLLQRGLLYHDGERAQSNVHRVRHVHRVHTDQNRRDAATPLPGFFGAVSPPTPPPGADEQEIEKVRKRQLEQRIYEVRSGSPAKRARLTSNGHDGGLPAAAVSEPLPMDVDEPATNGNGHAYPSPKDIESAPTPVLLTDGPTEGTQIPKVAELGSETTFLSLSDSPTPSKQVVLQCEWSPRDPTILAAAGTDALARLWNISRGMLTTDGNGHVSRVNGVSPASLDLVDEDTVKSNSTVCAIAWTSDGSAIAVASDYPEVDDAQARVTVWNTEGDQLHSYGGFEQAILCLRWNANNTHLLILMHAYNGETTSVRVLCPAKQTSAEYHMRNDAYAVNGLDLDAAWIDNYEFVVCGGDVLRAFKCTDDSPEPTLEVSKKYETRPDHKLARAVFDRRSKLLATSSENGSIDVWDEYANSYTISAHRERITSLSWQPIGNQTTLNDHSERLLVSADDEGVINVWNARLEGGKLKNSMTMDSSVLALAFTPDGAFLAAATTTQILIWRTEDVSVPRARWALDQETGWQSPKSTGSYDEEHQHCLSWDADGQKLAYGVDNQLAVITWRPFGENTGH